MQNREFVLELFRQGIEGGHVSPEIARLTGHERNRAAKAYYRAWQEISQETVVLKEVNQAPLVSLTGTTVAELERAAANYLREIEVEAYARLALNQKTKPPGDFPLNNPVAQREWRVRKLHNKLAAAAAARRLHAAKERVEPEVHTPAVVPTPEMRPAFPRDPQQKMLDYVNGGYVCEPDESTEKGYITGPDAVRARAAVWMRDGKNDGTRDVSGVGVPRQDVIEGFAELEAMCGRIDVSFELIRRTIFSLWGGGAAKMDDLLPAHYGEVFVAIDSAVKVQPDFTDTDSADNWEYRLDVAGEAVQRRPTSTNAFMKFVDVVVSIMKWELKWLGERGSIADHGYHYDIQKRAFTYLSTIPKYEKILRDWDAVGHLEEMAEAEREDAKRLATEEREAA